MPPKESGERPRPRVERESPVASGQPYRKGGKKGELRVANLLQSIIQPEV